MYFTAIKTSYAETPFFNTRLVKINKVDSPPCGYTMCTNWAMSERNRHSYPFPPGQIVPSKNINALEPLTQKFNFQELSQIQGHMCNVLYKVIYCSIIIVIRNHPHIYLYGIDSIPVTLLKLSKENSESLPKDTKSSMIYILHPLPSYAISSHSPLCSLPTGFLTLQQLRLLQGLCMDCALRSWCNFLSGPNVAIRGLLRPPFTQQQPIPYPFCFIILPISYYPPDICSFCLSRAPAP